MADSWHRRTLEHRSALFAALTTAAISIGGMVEIAPMFSMPIDTTGISNYTPLQVAGRDIYVREGCYNCHSQMIRPLRSETLRYGTWSRAEEYAWDRPFQLGSRRIGPDLMRVGGKYPNAWHFEHLRDPRSTSPGSIMPSYHWLIDDKVDPADITASINALRRLGAPYPADLDVAASMHADAQVIVDNLATAKVTVEPDREVIALIAYLQHLGVDGRKKWGDGTTADAAPVGTPAEAP